MTEMATPFHETERRQEEMATHGAREAAGTPRGCTGRIGYLAKMFPRISETFILNEVLALRRHGVPLRIYSVLAPTRDARVHPEARDLMDEVYVLPEPSWSAMPDFLAALAGCLWRRPYAVGKRLWHFLCRPGNRTFKRLFHAVHLAQRMHLDRVAHLHAAWAHTPASIARIAARLNGIPWSMGAHAKDIHLSHLESVRKKLQSARYTLTCTRTNCELLDDIGKPTEELPAPSVELFYHGVDTDYFQVAHEQAGEPARPTSCPPMILSVGRLVPKKGFDLLIEAAALLRQRGSDFRIEIVGAGDLRRGLEKQIFEAGLEDRVTLRGLLTRNEVREAYARADCVVLASRIAGDGDRDGIPNTLVEAMGCGLPVVATQLPGIAELVVHGKTGLLVPPEDPTALADALERMLHDPALRHRMGHNGRHRVVHEFDADNWGRLVVERLRRSLGIEKVLYLSADRGVPVQGSKGASVHLRSVTKALHALGVDTCILTTRRGPEDGPKPSGSVLEIRTEGRLARAATRIDQWMRGNNVIERELLRLFDNFSLYRAGLAQGRAWHADLLYERYSLTAFAGGRIARRLGIPHIIEVNAPLAHEEKVFRQLRFKRFTNWAEGWILRRADRVVVVSQALSDHVRRLGVRPEKILVLPNGVDPELFHPGRDGVAKRRCLGLDGNFVVGFSGSLKSWHGLDYLLRAFAGLVVHVPKARLLLIGDGPGRETLHRLAENLGIADRTHFTGAIPHEEVGAYLASCDALTAPYGPMENFYFSPLKVVEYLATGRPVVVSAIGPLAQTLDTSKGAVLVPPGNVDALRDALTTLALDGRQREKLARAAVCYKPWMWHDVLRCVLEAGEALRREYWGWEEKGKSLYHVLTR